MSEVDPGFSVKKPVSVWNRPLKADAKGIFKSAGKAVLHGATAQWASLGADALEGFSALGVGQDAGQLAWVLARRALLVAMEELAKESVPPLETLQKAELAALSDRLDEALGETEVTIDRSFFERPASLQLLAELQAPFAEWLQGIGLPPPAARSTALRLPSYFTLALHSEWSLRPADYEPIRTKVETPFTAAADRERAWALYAARLERQIDEPMFGEAFGLRQVYVPLRAFYFEDDRTGAPAERFAHREAPPGHEKEKGKKVAVDLEAEIDAWLLHGKKDDTCRILSGGPGSGKSSFAKMYAAKAAREGHRVLFIPLHQFNVSGSLPAAVGEYVRGAEILPANPLDPESAENQLLLIFDGLDELSQQGRLAAEVARDFVREVQKVVEIRNQQHRRLLVLITGREPVVQANASEMRERRRILHALPYLIERWEKDESQWSSGVNLLEVDQRQEWWQRYAKAAGKNYKGLPKELSREDLSEITAQPLLNYLVALSLARGRLNFSQEINLNDIYEDLLAAVHSRTYERPHLAIRGMELQEFTRVLEEIALAAWHGNGRTTTVAEIEAHCKAAGLSSLLERFEEGAKGGVTRVLTAFYFRQFGQTSTGDRTFEFTHKSFREYLTALRIVRALRRIQEETERRHKNYDSGWEDRQALLHWAEICGPNPMDRELCIFVRSEVRKAGAEVASAWQLLLCRLISGMLRHGMPLELLSPRLSFKLETRQARNAEEALLATLNACARVTEQVSRIDWPGKDGGEGEGTEVDWASAGAWITRLRGQRIGGDNVLALDCLSFLDLSECILDMVDLYGAGLARTHLQRSYLIGATLWAANLQSTNLEGANLFRANLEGANLLRADLQGANLQRANLQGANLQGANLQGADINDAYLDEEALKQAIGTAQGTPNLVVWPAE